MLIAGPSAGRPPRIAKGQRRPAHACSSDLRPAGDGIYKGRAFEPKRDISGSATIRQVGPNVMVVKGCAIIGLFCKEQRWTANQLSATPSAANSPLSTAA